MFEKGQQIGRYKILSAIGAGGMGEVFLAEDVRLKRRVALKILPAAFGQDKERLNRFEQEACAASALNHPNILTIHEFSTENGVNFIAAEYIKGETLRDRRRREALTLREALDIALQVAAALNSGHEAGIVHRDIKPENIMLRDDQLVKVLDFGLAKLTERKQETIDTEGETRAQVKTAPGMVMGTAAYMSPEQARGKQTDARSDIWSLGVVLYEMLAGRAPFEGETTTDVLAAILHREPAPLDENINPELQRITRKTLRKSPEERYQTVKDFLIDLKSLKRDLEMAEEIERSQIPTSANTNSSANSSAEGGGGGTALQQAAVSTQNAAAVVQASSAEYVAGEIKKHGVGVLIALVFLALVVTGAGYGIYKLINKPGKSGVSFETAKLTRLTTTGKASGVAISPDGKYVVHVQDDGGQQSLWTRQVVTQSNVQIVPPGAVTYESLVFSPDGNYIYYCLSSQDFPQRALFQLPTLGGEPKKLLANLDVDTISFSPDGKQFAFIRYEIGKEYALMIANADGSGERKLLVHKNPPESLGWPAWSPDGKRIAYTVTNYDTNDVTVYEAQIADGSTRPLTTQRWFRIVGLAWLADGNGLLMLAPSEQKFHAYQIWRLSYPDGAAQRLTNDLDDYESMSLTPDSGVLAVVKSVTQSNIWIAPNNDAGRARPVTSGSGKVDNFVSCAPDGRIVYTSNAGGNDDIWIANADGSNARQLTVNSRVNRMPTVTPDGRYILFMSDRTGLPHLWKMNIDGSDQKQLTDGSGGEQSAQVSPDGRWIVYSTVHGKRTVWKIPAEGGEPVQLSDKYSSFPTISPDGKSVAYFYQEVNAPWRIALAPLEGGEPTRTFATPPTFSIPLRWTAGTRALAYIDTQKGVSNIWTQPIDGGPPKQLTDFKSDRIFWFDFSRDGKHLVLARGTVNNDVVLISNFK